MGLLALEINSSVRDKLQCPSEIENSDRASRRDLRNVGKPSVLAADETNLSYNPQAVNSLYTAFVKPK